MNISELEEQIKKHRLRLESLYKNKMLIDEEVLATGALLNDLCNQYQKIYNEKSLLKY